MFKDKTNSFIKEHHERYGLDIGRITLIKEEIKELTERLKALEEKLEIETSIYNLLQGQNKSITTYQGVLMICSKLKYIICGEERYHIAIKAPGKDFSRYANIYNTIENPSVYGAHIYEGKSSSEHWLGSDWKDLEALFEACFEWIVSGLKP